MLAEELLTQSKHIEKTLITIRHQLHAIPETGFDLTKTKTYVKNELQKLGYEPQDCGKAGLVAIAGGKKNGKVFLIRADMDALPIQLISLPKTAKCMLVATTCTQPCCLVLQSF